MKKLLVASAIFLFSVTQVFADNAGFYAIQSTTKPSANHALLAGGRLDPVFVQVINAASFHDINIKIAGTGFSQFVERENFYFVGNANPRRSIPLIIETPRGTFTREVCPHAVVTVYQNNNYKGDIREGIHVNNAFDPYCSL